ncbi:MAG: serine/threonine-protein kinase [Mogibacterium sp.]|nr:serine/threonine-protein kinase [Mogibacterium sp.]
MSEQLYWHDWNIMETIGSGSYGTVYRIERRDDFGHFEESALKVIRIPHNPGERDSILSDSESPEAASVYIRGMVEGVVREFDLMAQLKGHSNIVSYEDRDIRQLDDGITWEISIRMELLTPLNDYIRENKISLADIIRIGTDICRALEFCEKKNILHRDIKPENIFYSEQGSFKLGDFGIARQLDATSASTARRGTIAYMAPEVFKGERYNSTADLYSLGLVLYRLLNYNRLPFLPDYPKPITYADKERSYRERMEGKTMPPPANADEMLTDTILKACAYKPKNRWQTAAEMRRALQASLRKAGASTIDKADDPDYDDDNQTVASTETETDAGNEPTVVEKTPGNTGGKTGGSKTAGGGKSTGGSKTGNAKTADGGKSAGGSKTGSTKTTGGGKSTGGAKTGNSKTADGGKSTGSSKTGSTKTTGSGKTTGGSKTSGSKTTGGKTQTGKTGSTRTAPPKQKGNASWYFFLLIFIVTIFVVIGRILTVYGGNDVDGLPLGIVLWAAIGLVAIGFRKMWGVVVMLPYAALLGDTFAVLWIRGASYLASVPLFFSFSSGQSGLIAVTIIVMIVFIYWAYSIATKDR